MTPPSLDLPEGLRLVPLREEHAPALAQMVSRNAQHLGRYLEEVVRTIRTVEGALAHIREVQRATAAGELCEWHVLDGDALCAAVRLNRWERDIGKVAIAYYVDAARQGRGVVTAAARRVLRYAFEELGVQRVELRCATSNVASRRVAEKLGFTLEGELRRAERLPGEGLTNLLVFGLLREEMV